jgi:hypothetical protein
MVTIASIAPGALPAATYAPLPDAILIAKSDLIVRGRVSRVESVEGAAGGIVTLVGVEVDRTLKGRGPASVVVEQPGGRIGDAIEVYPGIGTFFEGEELLLMLEDRGSAVYRLTDFAMGKFRASLAPDGSEYYRRDGLKDAAVLGASGAFVTGLSIDADRDAILFEAYIEEVTAGYAPPPDYFVPGRDAAAEGDLMDPIAEFTFLGSTPAHWIEFDTGGSVTIVDNSGGDAGSNCPTGCHTEVGLGVTGWNNAAGSLIDLQYGGTDGSIGSKCLNSLDDEIQFNDPCGEIPDLAGCSGTLALGGFSGTASGGGTGCAVQGGLSFGRITAGRILVNNGVGSCLSSCNYQDMVTHESGHMLGAGHSTNSSALMAPFLASGRCGALQLDDLGFSQCSYEGAATPCAGPSPVITSVQAVRRKGIWKAKVFGSGFTKGAIVQIDSGSGWASAPKTVFKKKRKVIGKDVETIWPVSLIVSVRVTLPTGCESNIISAQR